MDRWDGIREFLEVVRVGTFTGAAKALGVSASHVSRQVARLEARLDVKLLARSTRVVRLTDAGAEYHRRMAELAAAIDETNRLATGADAELAGRIRVSAAGVFAEQHVAPALAAFAAQHPQVLIEMDFNTRYVDLIDQGFDFAIRYGVSTDQRLIARRLTRRRMVCVAAPAYLERAGVPETPEQLKAHACLRTNRDRWTFRDPESGAAIDVRVSGPWRANNGHAVRAGVLAGLGIAYMPEENLQPALDQGALRRILEGYEDPERSSYLVFVERRLMPRRVRAAIDHLVATFCPPSDSSQA